MLTIFPLELRDCKVSNSQSIASSLIGFQSNLETILTDMK